MNNLAKTGVVLVDLTGMKWALLVNLSTMTHIHTFPQLDLENPSIKSIEIESHFHIGISKDRSNPLGF